jgi:cytochrome c-type biogenesis protein CcmH/NrfG
MKNVQMRINPELYAKFKLVDGESNNERMSKLLADSKEKYQLIESCENVLLSAKELRAVNASKNATIKTLASALVISIAVSVCSVAYVCVVNGWFA